MLTGDLNREVIFSKATDNVGVLSPGFNEFRDSKKKSFENWEDEQHRLLSLVEPDRECEEDLSNLADIVPGLFCMQKALQSNSGSGFKRAYSSKLLEKHGNTQKQRGVEVIGEVFSVEVTDVANNNNNNNIQDDADNNNNNSVQLGENDNNNNGNIQVMEEDVEITAPSRTISENVVLPITPIVAANSADNAGGSCHSSENLDEADNHEQSASPFRIIAASQVVIPQLMSFTPATGCRDASDFIVRCFVARLRSGITIMKHGRNRWCSSKMRIIQFHEDGRSFTWKSEDNNKEKGLKRKKGTAPRLNLRTCLEVRHAWTPDPLNASFTGTPILRLKCEPESAHKSFSLIFPERTIDMTAMTADQCRVLMEGFSALIYRLQAAGATEDAKHRNMLEDYFFLVDDKETSTETAGSRSMQAASSS